MNISGKVEKLSVVFDVDGTKWALEDMAFFVIFSIEIFTVRSKDALHVN